MYLYTLKFISSNSHLKHWLWFCAHFIDLEVLYNYWQFYNALFSNAPKHGFTLRTNSDVEFNFKIFFLDIFILL